MANETGSAEKLDSVEASIPKLYDRIVREGLRGISVEVMTSRGMDLKRAEAFIGYVGQRGILGELISPSEGYAIDMARFKEVAEAINSGESVPESATIEPAPEVAREGEVDASIDTAEAEVVGDIESKKPLINAAEAGDPNPTLLASEAAAADRELTDAEKKAAEILKSKKVVEEFRDSFKKNGLAADLWYAPDFTAEYQQRFFELGEEKVNKFLTALEAALRGSGVNMADTPVAISAVEVDQVAFIPETADSYAFLRVSLRAIGAGGSPDVAAEAIRNAVEPVQRERIIREESLVLKKHVNPVQIRSEITQELNVLQPEKVVAFFRNLRSVLAIDANGESALDLRGYSLRVTEGSEVLVTRGGIEIGREALAKDRVAASAEIIRQKVEEFARPAVSAARPLSRPVPAAEVVRTPESIAAEAKFNELRSDLIDQGLAAGISFAPGTDPAVISAFFAAGPESVADEMAYLQEALKSSYLYLGKVMVFIKAKNESARLDLNYSPSGSLTIGMDALGDSEKLAEVKREIRAQTEIPGARARFELQTRRMETIFPHLDIDGGVKAFWEVRGPAAVDGFFQNLERALKVDPSIDLANYEISIVPGGAFSVSRPVRNAAGEVTAPGKIEIGHVKIDEPGEVVAAINAVEGPVVAPSTPAVRPPAVVPPPAVRPEHISTPENGNAMRQRLANGLASIKADGLVEMAVISRLVATGRHAVFESLDESRVDAAVAHLRSLIVSSGKNASKLAVIVKPESDIEYKSEVLSIGIDALLAENDPDVKMRFDAAIASLEDLAPVVAAPEPLPAIAPGVGGAPAPEPLPAIETVNSPDRINVLKAHLRTAFAGVNNPKVAGIIAAHADLMDLDSFWLHTDEAAIDSAAGHLRELTTVAGGALAGKTVSIVPGSSMFFTTQGFLNIGIENLMEADVATVRPRFESILAKEAAIEAATAASPEPELTGPEHALAERVLRGFRQLARENHVGRIMFSSSLALPQMKSLFAGATEEGVDAILAKVKMLIDAARAGLPEDALAFDTISICLGDRMEFSTDEGVFSVGIENLANANIDAAIPAFDALVKGRAAARTPAPAVVTAPVPAAAAAPGTPSATSTPSPAPMPTAAPESPEVKARRRAFAVEQVLFESQIRSFSITPDAFEAVIENDQVAAFFQQLRTVLGTESVPPVRGIDEYSVVIGHGDNTRVVVHDKEIRLNLMALDPPAVATITAREIRRHVENTNFTERLEGCIRRLVLLTPMLDSAGRTALAGFVGRLRAVAMGDNAGLDAILSQMLTRFPAHRVTILKGFYPGTEPTDPAETEAFNFEERRNGCVRRFAVWAAMGPADERADMATFLARIQNLDPLDAAGLNLILSEALTRFPTHRSEIIKGFAPGEAPAAGVPSTAPEAATVEAERAGSPSEKEILRAFRGALENWYLREGRDPAFPERREFYESMKRASLADVFAKLEAPAPAGQRPALNVDAALKIASAVWETSREVYIDEHNALARRNSRKTFLGLEGADGELEKTVEFYEKARNFSAQCAQEKLADKEESGKKYAEILPEKQAAIDRRIFDEFVIKEHDVLSRREVEQGTPWERNRFQKAWDLYKGLPANRKREMTIFVGVGVGAVIGSTVGLAAGAAYLGQRGIRMVAGSFGGAGGHLAADAGIKVYDSTIGRKSTFEHRVGELRQEAADAKNVSGKLDELKKKYQEKVDQEQKKQKKRKAINATVAVAGALIAGASASSAFADVLGLADHPNVGGLHDQPGAGKGIHDAVDGKKSALGDIEGKGAPKVDDHGIIKGAPTEQIAKPGDSEWSIAERELRASNRGFANLNEAGRTNAIATLVDDMQKHPEQFGLKPGQVLHPNDHVDFSHLDQKHVADIVKHASNLSPEQQANILGNNQAIRDWMKAHPGRPLSEADGDAGRILGNHHEPVAPEEYHSPAESYPEHAAPSEDYVNPDPIQHAPDGSEGSIPHFNKPDVEFQHAFGNHQFHPETAAPSSSPLTEPQLVRPAEPFKIPDVHFKPESSYRGFGASGYLDAAPEVKHALKGIAEHLPRDPHFVSREYLANAQNFLNKIDPKVPGAARLSDQQWLEVMRDTSRAAGDAKPLGSVWDSLHHKGVIDPVAVHEKVTSYVREYPVAEKYGFNEYSNYDAIRNVKAKDFANHMVHETKNASRFVNGGRVEMIFKTSHGKVPVMAGGEDLNLGRAMKSFGQFHRGETVSQYLLRNQDHMVNIADTAAEKLK